MCTHDAAGGLRSAVTYGVRHDQVTALSQDPCDAVDERGGNPASRPAGIYEQP
jgi:hypothetical protein